MQRNVKYQRQESSGSDTFEPENSGKVGEKKNAHTAAEQKRRDAIKGGLDQLERLVPGCHQCDTSHGIISKTSKAQVLQKAIDYLRHLTTEKDKKDAEIAEVEKKLVALNIVKDNYENLVKTSHTSSRSEVTDQMKLNVFRHMMSAIWKTFGVSVSVGSFQLLSGSLIGWLEEHCKPETVNVLFINALRYVLGS